VPRISNLKCRAITLTSGTFTRSLFSNARLNAGVSEMRRRT
jgi:hypothetical protein